VTVVKVIAVVMDVVQTVNIVMPQKFLVQLLAAVI
jgi:hypothetical protein